MGIESCDRGGFSGLGARRLTAKVKLGFDLREGEGYGMGVAVQGEGVDPWASGIAQTEEFGDFVIGFARSVVDGAADEGVVPGAVGRAGEIEMCVATGDDEGESGLVVEIRAVGFAGGTALVEEDGMDVPLKMVDGDERDVLRVGEGLCVDDADEEGSGKART